MATSYQNAGSFLSNYRDLNTIPALMGVLFAVASAVQFLGATISVTIPYTYTLSGVHAMVLSLVVLVVAFAASDTRSWEYYEGWEQAMVGIAVLVIVGNEYIAEITNLVANNNPAAGTIAFIITMAAWGILSR
jgi:hypothetical protein